MTCSPNQFDAQQKRNSREARLFPQSWVWFFRFQHVSFFRPNDATLDAHHATSVLNQNNHTTFNKLSRYVLVTCVTILFKNYDFVALYQKKPTRVLVFCFPLEWDRRFISARSSSQSWLRFVRKFDSFVNRVRSRRPCGRGSLGVYNW